MRMFWALAMLAACDDGKGGDTGGMDTGWQCREIRGACPDLTVDLGDPGAVATAWQCLADDCAPAEMRIWTDDAGTSLVAYCVDLTGATGDSYAGAWDTLIVSVCAPGVSGGIEIEPSAVR